MSRSNVYVLTRLSTGAKAMLSALLLTGAALFFASWAFSLEVSRWALSGNESLLWLGTVVRRLAWDEPRAYTVLVGVVGGASLVLVLSAIFVFRRTALRRRAKAGFILATTVAFVLEIVAWLTAPLLYLSEVALLPLSVVVTVLSLVLVAVPLKQMWFYTRFSSPTKKRVVVVGGGFAGLDVARRLDSKIGWSSEVEIVLVDRRNYFLFPPLLPSVAAGTIETRQVTYPFRRIFETTNVIFRKAEVTSIDPTRKQLTSRIEFDKSVGGGSLAKNSTLHYDVIVLCPGAVSQTFGTPGVEEHAFFMRELGDAIAIRNHVIDCFEQAAAAASRERQRELLRFVIVGAGPTGVELATEIHDLAYHVLLPRYPEISAADVDVAVVQSGAQVLPGWDDGVVQIATKQLARLDIRLVLGTRVTKVEARDVHLKNGTCMRTRTVVWCAGVRSHPLLQACDLEVAKDGRATIEADLRATGHDDIFVLGDAAHLMNAKTERPYPPLGQVAFQQGKQGADNVLRALSGQKLRPFKYFDFGALVSVGERYAAVHLLGVRLRGALGWFVWRTLYLGKLVGAGNKIRVVLDWTLDLVVERSISQILERDVAEIPPPEDAIVPLDNRELRDRIAAATEALAGVTSSSSYTETKVESEHGLQSEPSLRAAVTARSTDAGIALSFEATLPPACVYEATLNREDGLLGRDAFTQEPGLDDVELGQNYVIDAGPDCAGLFSAVKQPLLDLAAHRAEVEFEGSALRVRVRGLNPTSNELHEVYGALVALWTLSVATASVAAEPAPPLRASA